MTAVTVRVKRPRSWDDSLEECAAQITNRELQAALLRYARIWDQHYQPSFLSIRKSLSAISRQYTAYSEDDGHSEWLLLRDDDDIHFELPDEIWDQPPDVVMLGFSVYRYNITPRLTKELLRPNYLVGCRSNGIAVRRWYFRMLTDEQVRLLTGDHANAHRYVHFSGYRYVLYPHLISGIHLVHPTSLTMARDGIDPLQALCPKEELQLFIPDCPSFVRAVIDLFLSVREGK